MTAVGCGINHTNNAGIKKQKQHRNKVMKPQTNTFSKYYEDNTKKT
jgi:hypothetical protein